MYIDFHVHAFVDSIAPKAVAKLCDVAKIVNYSDATEADTRAKLSEWGIDYGVMLPIATKPSQQTTINNWAAEINHDNLICFGTVHPFADNVAEEIERVKALGLKGIKLHPDYQGVFLFDEKMDSVYAKCEELGLPIIIHMGYDPVSPLVHHAMPYDLIDVAKRYPKLKIIAAHMGGVNAWESVLHYIAGIPNIWLDTAYTEKDLDDELYMKLIRKHGADRILFASDLPWNAPTMEIEIINRLPLTDEEREMIFWKNAAKLLEL